MIPKIIHYCWFGKKPLPELAEKSIASWKQFCPDYEIKEWNESNFNLDCCDYVREAYEAKRWAFVSDVARLYALVKEGGVYMDTDVEVLKSLDPILKYEAVSGFEAGDRVPTGIMACRAGHPLFMELFHDYDDAHFVREDGSYDQTTNVERITNTCLKYGLKLNNIQQTVKGFTLFPNDFFCPKDYRTKELYVTENTYVIHHFDGSWVSDEDKYSMQFAVEYERFFPKGIAGKLGRFKSIKKCRGFRCAIHDTVNWLMKKGKADGNS